MCAKRYKLALPSSSQRIRKAKKTLQSMPMENQIDLMVKAGAMTQQQGEKAKQKLTEIEG
jgi:hypothetical protein